MAIHASGITGTEGVKSTAGTYLNEVFVDDASHYIGDFSAGAGVDGVTPLGWAHGTSFPQPSYYDCSGAVVGGVFGLFAPFWYPDACGPLANMAFTNGCFAGTIVPDPSGPPGLESENACRIDFNGGAYPNAFSWIGEDASLINGLSSDLTNWNPTHDQVWQFSGWFRSTPDPWTGFDMAGFAMDIGYAQRGYPPIAQISFTVTGSWQFVTGSMTWIYSTGANGIPVISVIDSRAQNDFTQLGMTKHMRRGSVLMKHVHLYTSFQGAARHVAQRF